MPGKIIKIAKIKKGVVFLKKLPRILGENAFLTFCGLFILFLILGALLFYKYSLLAEKEGAGDLGRPLRFEEKTYKTILSYMEGKEKMFEAAGKKQYLNPFKIAREEETLPSLPEPEETIPEGMEVLLKAVTLSEFYQLKGEAMPSIESRSRIWNQMGFGPAESYLGSRYQNFILLEELKKQLTK
ncbi:MAG: hypothetical protein ABIG08_01550 [bacterium]